MSSGQPSRAAQRVASEAAILDAAVELYAQCGPDGVSLREVAQRAGLTHALVARYFGSKHGLVTAVESVFAAEVRATTSHLTFSDADELVAVLAAARARPTWTKLLVRSGLGDLAESVVPTAIAERCTWAVDGDRRQRLCAYSAASVLLGWWSWEGFLTNALQLDRVSRRRRDAAVAAAAMHAIELGRRSEPTLAPRPWPPADAVSAVWSAERAGGAPRDALLVAAVQLFAERGPASASIRNVARLAGVNHGLVHRHFGSKDDLLAEAVEVGSAPLQLGALRPEGFDVDSVVHAMHQLSASPRMIARILVDDIPIERVRSRYPVVDGLRRFAQGLPTAARPAALAEPRLAAATAASLVVGSAIWGDRLRTAFGVADDGVESAVADIGRRLLGALTADDR